MGSASSRIWSKSLDENQYGTPRQRRQELRDDPRSPTEEIHRTPIVVEDTTAAGYHHCELDPRSPACGFQRTPIVVNQSQGDPRSPSSNVVRTPVDELKQFTTNLDAELAVTEVQGKEKCSPQNTNVTEKQDVSAFVDVNKTSPAQQRVPKQLFASDWDEFSKPRTPLAVTNRPNISLRIRTQQRVAAAKQMDTSLTRKTPALASGDKENSPMFLTNM